MFINLSNHASEKWSPSQLAEAQKYGPVLDIPFPAVDPRWDDEAMNQVVDEYAEMVFRYGQPVVMVQGEFIFTYRMICRLKERGLKVLAACSERCSVETTVEDGSTVRRSEFRFVCFHEY